MARIFGDITGLSGKITYFISVFSDTISSMGLGTYIDLPLGAKEITAKLTSIAIGIVSGFVTSIPILLLDIVIYLFATYYFMRNGHEIICAVKDYASTLPQEDEKFISSIIKGLKKSFDVLIISYIGMAFITSVFSFIGYYIFGVPHAFLLANSYRIIRFSPGFWNMDGLCSCCSIYVLYREYICSRRRSGFRCGYTKCFYPYGLAAIFWIQTS